MKQYIEQLRVVVAALAVVVALAVSTYLERQSLARDLLEIERLFVAYTLLTTPSSAAQPSDREATNLQGNNAENFFDDLTTYQRTAAIPEVNALVDFMKNAPWELYQRIALPTGGWLYYRTVPGRFSVTDQPAQPTCERRDENGEALFRMELEIRTGSNIVGKPFAMEFSNAHCEIDRRTLDYLWRAGETTVTVAVGSGDGSRRSTRDLAAEILRLSERWTEAPQSVNAAYARVRALYQQRSVELPLLQSEVSADNALTVLAGIACALSVYMSFLFRQLSSRRMLANDESWLLLDPIRSLPRSPAVRAVALIEIACFMGLFAAAILAPIAVALLAVTSRSEAVAVTAIALFVSTVMTSSSMVNFFRVVGSAPPRTLVNT